MNITPDTEPLGSEHHAEGLAQRALELADEYDRQADRHTLIATDPFADAGWQQEQAGECLEKAAILRHYAEILPKWQAVLDAEPKAWFNTKWGMSADVASLKQQIGEAGTIEESPAYIAGELAPLIIKPAP